MLHEFIKNILPPIISICELIGIFIVVITVITSFYNYMRGLILHIPSNAKYQLANGLATSLSFKMAAELLKTVIVTSWFEVMMLAAIIVLRAMMAVMLHFETKNGFVQLEAAHAKNKIMDEMEAAALVFDESQEEEQTSIF